MVNIFEGLIFRPPASFLVNSMTVVTTAVMMKTGIDEMRGKEHMQYSKLVNNNHVNKRVLKVSSRQGMLLFYTPAFLCTAASFFIFPMAIGGADETTRFLLLRSALAIHFLKRILEVLYLHNYSGGMPIDAVLKVSPYYFLTALTMIYAQFLSLQQQLPVPETDLKYVGVVLFLIGIAGNFYHHYILSTLREKKEGKNNKNKDYKIPHGGFFDLVVCPHYLFEVLGFLGVSFIAQTFYSLSFTIATTAYLMGRSYATRRWYASKFEDFPAHVKCIIPFLF